MFSIYQDGGRFACGSVLGMLACLLVVQWSDHHPLEPPPLQEIQPVKLTASSTNFETGRNQDNDDDFSSKSFRGLVELIRSCSAEERKNKLRGMLAQEKTKGTSPRIWCELLAAGLLDCLDEPDYAAGVRFACRERPVQFYEILTASDNQRLLKTALVDMVLPPQPNLAWIALSCYATAIAKTDVNAQQDHYRRLRRIAKSVPKDKLDSAFSQLAVRDSKMMDILRPPSLESVSIAKEDADVQLGAVLREEQIRLSAESGRMSIAAASTYLTNAEEINEFAKARLAKSARNAKNSQQLMSDINEWALIAKPADLRSSVLTAAESVINAEGGPTEFLLASTSLADYVRNVFESTLIAGIARRDVYLASLLLSRIQNPSSESITALIEQIRDDPEAAYAWGQKLPDGSERDKVLNDLEAQLDFEK